MLARTIPAWVNLRCLDSSWPDGYGMPVPPDQASALREAAAEHQLALQPSDPADRRAVLLGLRSATLLINERAEEAEATVKMLRVHLADVPLDILEAACRAYCNAPGRRFFPKSAGELRTFINPLVRERQGRAFRLLKLAERAEAEDAERERIEADPLTPEAIAAIKAEFGLDRAMPGPVRAVTVLQPARPLPTVADYVGLGLSAIEAEQMVSAQAMQVARSRPPGTPIGAGIVDHLQDAIAAE